MSQKPSALPSNSATKKGKKERLAKALQQNLLRRKTAKNNLKAKS